MKHSFRRRGHGLAGSRILSAESQINCGSLVALAFAILELLLFILDLLYFRALFYFKLVPTMITKLASKNHKITISHKLTPKAKIFHLIRLQIIFCFISGL